MYEVVLMISSYKKEMEKWKIWIPRNYAEELSNYKKIKERYGQARADYVIEARFPLVPRVMLVRRFK